MMQQRNINKDCRVLFGDIFIVPFLGPALGYVTAMCTPGWGNLVAFDWNDLPVGRELDCRFLKNVKSPPHALPPPPPTPRRLYIDRCIIFKRSRAQNPRPPALKISALQTEHTLPWLDVMCVVR